MSKFIDELRQEIGTLALADGWSSNLRDVKECQDTLDSLGDNARKMLDIGIVMDDLAALGFKHKVRSSKFNIIEIDCLQLLLPKSHSRYWIEVMFTKDYAYLSQTDERFFFTVEN